MLAPPINKTLWRLMQNKLFGIGAELKKDCSMDVEMGELNDPERFTWHFLHSVILSLPC